MTARVSKCIVIVWVNVLETSRHEAAFVIAVSFA